MVFIYPMTDPWCWYINANMTGVNLDGIHGAPYIAAPWIRHEYTSTMSHGKSTPVLWYFFHLHHGVPWSRPWRRGQEGLRCLLDATVRGWQFRGSALRGGVGSGAGNACHGGVGWKRVGSAEVAGWWKMVENGGKWWKMRSYTCFHGALCFLLSE